MKPLIVANWKMNPKSLVEAKRLFDSVAKGIKNVKNIEVVICPPFPYLTVLNSEFSTFKLGGQDCFWGEKGAFTGEVSPKMLKDLRCQYVILGHSERRRHLNETDEMVNKKLNAALKEKLKPILCVANFLQLKKDLKGIPANDFNKIIVAYEPLFAIGTGKPCSPEKAKKIRTSIQKMNKNLTVLYGGSVNYENTQDYIEKAGFQGLLIGGASLNPQEFLKIVKSID